MDPHFLLLNWKRDIFGDILCPSEGQWPPHISSFVAWSRSSSHMCWDSGYLLPMPGASPSSGRWKKRSHFILVLFLSFSFIHWLKMFVHDPPLSLYMDTYPLLWSQAQPCPWKLRPFGDQCQLFGDHCLCLKLWQFEIISVGMEAQQIRCHQSLPHPGPRIGQFQNRKQSHDNVDVVGNDDGCW